MTKTFIIDRSKWLYGDTTKESALYLPNIDKYCCLGLIGLQCGLTKEDMSNVPSPESLDMGDIPYSYGNLFLFSDDDMNNHITEEIMSINDDAYLTPEEREIKLSQEFRHLDIELTFIGDYNE